MKDINSEPQDILLDLALASEERTRSLWHAYYAAKYGDKDSLNAHLMSISYCTTDPKLRKAINTILLNVL